MTTITAKSALEMAQELRDIQTEMIDLIHRAGFLLDDAPQQIRDRAARNWLPLTRKAAVKYYGYPTGCTCNMEDTIQDLLNIHDEGAN